MSQSDVRQPGLQVFLNGFLLSSVFEAEIQSNAYMGADRFSVRAALAGLDYDLVAALPLQIEIQVGLGGSWQSLIEGRADILEVDPIRGEIQIIGRDMTSVFIAAQTHESFENLTSSDVVGLLANRHGMTAVAAPTTTLIGRYYQNSHTRSAMSQHGRATTEWEILGWLAQQEGFDLWVSGAILYFQPAPVNQGTVSVTPADCINMSLERDLIIGSGVTVEVQSWDCVSQQAVSAKVDYGTGASNNDNMVTLRPNLSVSDAFILAQRTASQLGTHERTVSYEVPADMDTMPRMQVEIMQTDTDFDGVYRIYEVERRFSFRHGFTQQVQARRPSWTIS